MTAIPDSYNPTGTDWTRPAQNGQAVTAGSSVIADPAGNARPFRGIYVGATGDVTVTMAGGGSVQFVALAPGIIHPIAGTKITAATATSIVVVY